MRKMIHDIDWMLWAGLFGVVFISFLTTSKATVEASEAQDLIWVMALVGFGVLSSVPLKLIGRMSWVLYVLALVVIIWTGYLADSDSFRWQATAIINWVVVLLLAHYFSSRDTLGWSGLASPLFIIVVPAVATLNMFGLGSMVTLLFFVLVVTVAAKQWRLLGVSVAMLLLVSLLYWFNIQAYQQQRLLEWLDWQFSPIEAGELAQLPINTLVIVIFMISAMFLLWRMIKIVNMANNPFAFVLGVTVLGLIALFLMLKTAILLGLIPVMHGITPFVSEPFSLVIMFAMVGVLMRAAIESKERDEAEV